MALILATTVLAGGSPSSECADYGLIFQCKIEGGGATEGPSCSGFSLVEDNGDSWTVRMNASDVVRVKSGDKCEYTDYTSGYSAGEKDFSTSCGQDVSHITFCQTIGGDDEDPGNGVPEFSTFTLLAAVVIGTAGILTLRRR
ncbi:hypothetical protein JW711_05620 [Candidatus Woesearchaeota archaeon]|nr:hypothetical protein [Candidatus Woesearchaeota archaeon]